MFTSLKEHLNMQGHKSRTQFQHLGAKLGSHSYKMSSMFPYLLFYPLSFWSFSAWPSHSIFPTWLFGKCDWGSREVAKNPLFSYITFQVDQFPPLPGQADFTIGWMQGIVQGREKQARQNSITGCEHEAWGKPLLFQSQWLLVCHLCPWQCSFPHHHRFPAS